MTKEAIFIFIGLILFSYITCFSQARNRTNWLQEKKDYESRWRFSVGANIGEPSGANIQFYKVSRICTQAIAVRKKYSIDLALSYEGLLFGGLIEKNNPEWKAGGVRTNIDFKYYLPITLNPYIGIGGELGTRNLNVSNKFFTDIVGRIGGEIKIFGIKTSTRSMLHSIIFFEGKFNHCLSANFSYFVPCVGLRLHFL